MKTIEELEIYAKEHYVPIARKDLVAYLINFIKEKGYKKVLECGPGIGYTSIQIAKLDNVFVDTFEYYLPRYNVCKTNIQDFNLDNKINLSSEDILKAKLDNDYDLIFIDGAKKHTIEHFNYLKDKIKEGGTIIVDNIDLEVVNKIEIPKKKIKYQKVVIETKKYFDNLKEYKVVYLPIGDGIYHIVKNND